MLSPRCKPRQTLRKMVCMHAQPACTQLWSQICPATAHFEGVTVKIIHPHQATVSWLCYHGSRSISVTHHAWVSSGYLNCLSVEANNLLNALHLWVSYQLSGSCYVDHNNPPTRKPRREGGTMGSLSRGINISHYYTWELILKGSYFTVAHWLAGLSNPSFSDTNKTEPGWSAMLFWDHFSTFFPVTDERAESLNRSPSCAE